MPGSDRVAQRNPTFAESVHISACDRPPRWPAALHRAHTCHRRVRQRAACTRPCCAAPATTSARAARQVADPSGQVPRFHAPTACSPDLRQPAGGRTARAASATMVRHARDRRQHRRDRCLGPALRSLRSHPRRYRRRRLRRRRGRRSSSLDSSMALARVDARSAREAAPRQRRATAERHLGGPFHARTHARAVGRTAAPRQYVGARCRGGGRCSAPREARETHQRALTRTGTRAKRSCRSLTHRSRCTSPAAPTTAHPASARRPRRGRLG